MGFENPLRPTDQEGQEQIRAGEEERKKRNTPEAITARTQKGIQEMRAQADKFTNDKTWRHPNVQDVATEDIRTLRARMIDFAEASNPEISEDDLNAIGQHYEGVVEKVRQSQNNQEVADIIREVAEEASRKLSPDI